MLEAAEQYMSILLRPPHTTVQYHQKKKPHGVVWLPTVKNSTIIKTWPEGSHWVVIDHLMIVFFTTNNYISTAISCEKDYRVQSHGE
jgi:hypothetical protein